MQLYHFYRFLILSGFYLVSIQTNAQVQWTAQAGYAWMEVDKSRDRFEETPVSGHTGYQIGAGLDVPLPARLRAQVEVAWTGAQHPFYKAGPENLQRFSLGYQLLYEPIARWNIGLGMRVNKLVRRYDRHYTETYAPTFGPQVSLGYRITDQFSFRLTGSRTTLDNPLSRLVAPDGWRCGNGPQYYNLGIRTFTAQVQYTLGRKR